VLLAADPEVLKGEGDHAGHAHAAALFSRGFVGLERVTLIDADGHELYSIAYDGSNRPRRGVHDVSAAIALDAGTALVTASAPANGAPVAFVSTPIDAGTGAAPRVLRLELSIPRLLEATGVDTGQRSLYLVDVGAGALLGAKPGSTRTAAPPPEPGDVLRSLAARPSDASHWALGDGWHVAAGDLGSALDAWEVLLVGRVEQPTLPLALLGLLGALSVLLVAITVWMARQVIVPAQELARSREQLLQMYENARADALRDALTGLGNHRGFQEELEHQLDWYRRYKVPFALLLIDLDDLKLTNDTRGHSAGDELVRRMGRQIAETVRYADRAFRIGGDEFALLMPHTTADEAVAIGQRLLARSLADADGAIPFSGGVSACPALATTRQQLYAQADAALYWCKRHGRASLDVFDPVRDRDANEAATGGESGQVARVVAQRLLRAVYQPVVDLSSGAVIGFEGLTRPQPESGFANPGQLFTAAEAAGRTVELDHACLENVISQAAGLGPEQLLSVNLSPRTIEAPQFSAEWLVSVLGRHRMEPRRVIIELTEQQGIEDLPQLQRNLAALQRAGIRVAIDDVGAGNAGLRLLSQFRFDIVKIDLSLVQDGTRRDSSRAVLSSLRELAGRWNAYVVAEGIETVSQLRVVRELRLSAGQGYLLGRPMPAPTLARVDLAAIDAGGVVMQVRTGEAGFGAASPRPATN
jgi:diguanylate cyclase (GGDEF)-like protein